MGHVAGRDFPDLRVLHGELVPGVRFGVSSREMGASTGAFAHGNLADHVGDEPDAVERNRRSLADAMNAYRGLAVIGAAHGSTCSDVDQPGTYPGVDALATHTPGLGVLALGADCSVVGIGAKTAGGSAVAGVAHCGWRGLVADVIGSLVRQVESSGGRDLRAVIGPTVCGACYLVDDERASTVVRECSDAVVRAAVGKRVEDGRRELDIRAGVRERLVELGVQVVADLGCTVEDDRWFSFRGAVAVSASTSPANAITGRHGLCVVIEE